MRHRSPAPRPRQHSNCPAPKILLLPARQPPNHRRPNRRQSQHQGPTAPPRHDRTPRAGYLAVHSVEKSFGTRKVVRGVSIYVRRGEAVGLLGPNGAGKTTVFYMITGLIKADRGAIELDGHDVTKLPMYQRARLGIGYLPQEASIFRGLTVEQNIRAVLEVVETLAQETRGRTRFPARRIQHHAPAKDAVDCAVRRRAASRRNRARARHQSELHAARRALRRHRSDRGRRHSGPCPSSHQSRDRRLDHGPQCAGNARPDGPRLYRLCRRNPDRGQSRTRLSAIRMCAGFTWAKNSVSNRRDVRGWVL